MSSLRVRSSDESEIDLLCDCREVMICSPYNDVVYPKLASNGGGFTIALPNRLIVWPFQTNKIRTGLYVQFKSPGRCIIMLSLEGTELYPGTLFLTNHIMDRDGEILLEVINLSYSIVDIPPMRDLCKFFILEHRGDVVLSPDVSN